MKNAKNNTSKKSITVQWKGFSSKDTGYQSRQMMGLQSLGAVVRAEAPVVQRNIVAKI